MPDLRDVFNDLIRFEISLWNAIDRRLQSDFGLPLTQFEPLSVIDRKSACRAYDVAAELSITTGGASKLVDRIVASGYCRRKPNPDDRRSWLLELTPEGRTTLDQARASFDHELQRRVGDALPSGRIGEFATTLAELRSLSRRLDGANDTFQRELADVIDEHGA